jgi:hypothetical protein
VRRLATWRGRLSILHPFSIAATGSSWPRSTQVEYFAWPSDGDICRGSIHARFPQPGLRDHDVDSATTSLRKRAWPPAHGARDPASCATAGHTRDRRWTRTGSSCCLGGLKPLAEGRPMARKPITLEDLREEFLAHSELGSNEPGASVRPVDLRLDPRIGLEPNHGVDVLVLRSDRPDSMRKRGIGALVAEFAKLGKASLREALHSGPADAPGGRAAPG